MDNLAELKGTLKQKSGMLTYSDFCLHKAGRMQIKPGRTKAEIHKIISEL